VVKSSLRISRLTLRSPLSLSEREAIFSEVHRLKKSNPNLDSSELRSLLSSRFERLPSLETLKRWNAGQTAPNTCVNKFDAKPSEELSFFLGAWLGDGWEDHSDHGKRLSLKVRSIDFATEFASCATRILNKTEPYKVRSLSEPDGQWYFVKATSILLHQFANQPFPKLIEYIENHPIGFLRGFFTAEGNPSVSVASKRFGLEFAVTICVSCTCLDYIVFSREQLLKLGYRPTNLTAGYREGVPHPIKGVMYQSNATEWQFRLARIPEVERFLLEIGFADGVKQAKASFAAEILKKYGPRKSPEVWMREFEKVGRKWTRKGQKSLSSASS